MSRPVLYVNAQLAAALALSSAALAVGDGGSPVRLVFAVVACIFVATDDGGPLLRITRDR